MKVLVPPLEMNFQTGVLQVLLHWPLTPSKESQEDQQVQESSLLASLWKAPLQFALSSGEVASQLS